MKQLISFVSTLNKKKFLLASFVLSFFVLTTTHAQAQGIQQAVQNFINSSKVPAEIKQLNKADAQKVSDRTISKESFEAGSVFCKVQGGVVTTECIGGGTVSNVLAGLGQMVGMGDDQLVAVKRPDGTEELWASRSSGAISSITNLTASLVGSPVASSTEYVAYIFESLQHPLGTETAYAQGLGFSSLRPILGLWKMFRNLAYFFFVVIFLVVGIMIMFRSKIGSQAAVTVQQALPKIVISLLLVTFSYAIAGLMIDLMYLVIYMMIGIFTVSGTTNLSVVNLSDIAFRKGIFENGWNIMTGGIAGTVANSIGEMVGAILNLNANVGSTVGGLVQGGIAIVAYLVIALAILVNLFRIFFILLKAYAQLFFSVIFAPIQLLMGAIPGQNTFGTWIRGLVENLAIFPTLILLIFLANWLAYNPDISNATQQNRAIGGFSAPQLGSNQGSGGPIAFALLQFGILSLMPNVLELSKQIVKGKVDLDVGTIGKNLSKGWSGGEIIPGLGLSKMWGVGNIGSELPVEKALVGTRAFRERQREIKALNPDATVRRGGLAGIISNRPLRIIRTRQAKVEQAEERAHQSSAPGSTTATNTVGERPSQE